MKPKYLIVVPCFNESHNLPSLFRDIRATGLASTAHFLFVDDHSSDQTPKLLANSGLPWVRQPTNQGYGAAVKRGYRHALTENYDGFIVFPGDHQRSAKDVIRLIEYFERTGSDAVTGSKFHIYSKKYGPIRRRIGNRIFSRTAAVFWNSPIEDVLSGFKMYRTRSVQHFFEGLPEGYPFDIVFSLYASRYRLKVSEIPVDCKYNAYTTKMKSVLYVSFWMFSHALYHYLVNPLGQAALQKAPYPATAPLPLSLSKRMPA